MRTAGGEWGLGLHGQVCFVCFVWWWMCNQPRGVAALTLSKLACVPPSACFRDSSCNYRNELNSKDKHTPCKSVHIPYYIPLLLPATQAEGEEGPAPPPTMDADPTQTQCAISHEPTVPYF